VGGVRFPSSTSQSLSHNTKGNHMARKKSQSKKKPQPKYTIKERKTPGGKIYRYEQQSNSTLQTHYSTNDKPSKKPYFQPSMNKIRQLYYRMKLEGQEIVNIIVWAKLARSRGNEYQKGDQPDVHFTIQTDISSLLEGVIQSSNATEFVNYFEEYTNYAVSKVYSVGMYGIDV
jgi:hypothetical protein